MPLNQEEVKQLCEEACQAARQAGKLAMEYFGSEFEKNEKQSGSSEASSIVTEVDFKCQSLILDQLKCGIEKHDLGVLTEESTDNSSRFQKKYFWCIDPIDGTKPFSEHKPGFSVSIALIDQFGIPHIGVVYDPINQILYHAIREGGAFKNGMQWIVSSTQSKSLRFYFNQSFTLRDKFPIVLSELESIAQALGLSEVILPKQGGAVMNALWAAENSPSCFFAFPKIKDGGGSMWDYAATVCIYHELGLKVSDIYGDTLELNKRANSFMNEKGVLYASSAELRDKIIQLHKEVSG